MPGPGGHDNTISGNSPPISDRRSVVDLHQSAAVFDLPSLTSTAWYQAKKEDIYQEYEGQSNCRCGQASFRVLGGFGHVTYVVYGVDEVYV